MNNFTKEELETLVDMVSLVCKEYQQDDDNGTDLEDYWIPLENKLEKMAADYCEHEWEYKRQGSIVLGIYCLRCHKKLRGS